MNNINNQLIDSLDTVVLVKVGSHLFGTTTEFSDSDFRGIYKAKIADIILKKDEDSISFNSKSSAAMRRNNSKDTDCEYKELRKFIFDALQGQIYAIDMLFAPSSLVLRSSEIWQDIVKNRNKLLSKNLEPYVGFAKSQCLKYGIKGEKLKEALFFLEWLKTQDIDAKVGEVFKDFERESELIKLDQSTGHIFMMEKQFQPNVKVRSIIKIVEKWTKKYGPRSIQAMESNGVDSKALSHAVRSAFQIVELLNTGHLNLPLQPQSKADFIRDIKLGHYNDSYDAIQDILNNLLVLIENLVINSPLPDVPDYDFWNDRLLSYYV